MSFLDSAGVDIHIVSLLVLVAGLGIVRDNVQSETLRSQPALRFEVPMPVLEEAVSLADLSGQQFVHTQYDVRV